MREERKTLVYQNHLVFLFFFHLPIRFNETVVIEKNLLKYKNKDRYLHELCVVEREKQQQHTFANKVKTFSFHILHRIKCIIYVQSGHVG